MSTYCLKAEEIPMNDSYDVLIVGGGPAGCAAAIAAARHGAKVLLIEAQTYLGGMSTGGMVPTWCPFSDGERSVYEGIAREIFDLSNAALRVPKTSKFNWVQIDPEALKIIYDELLEKAGVDVLFSTFICQTDAENGHVDAVIAANKAGLTAYKAKIYIDATGDGDVAAFAGARFIEGDGDGHVQAATHCFELAGVNEEEYKKLRLHGGNADSPIYTIVKDKNHPLIDDTHICQSLVKPQTVGFNAGHLWNVHVDDVAGASKALSAGRKKAAAYLAALKDYEPAAFENAYVSETASMLGIRESRRVLGDYVLSTEDYLARQSFPDEIGRNCYYLDLHLTKEEVASGMKCESHRYGKGESHGIPYRVLTPVGFDNLLVAGRCISSDRAVNGSVRVMPVCLVTGQAAGTAAAMAAMGGLDVHTIDVDALRSKLREDGAYFL